jgi:effector-binding domain-containing protein
MAYEIEVKDLPARYVATVRVKTAPAKMGDTFGEVLPEVRAAVEAQGVRPVGPPFGLFHEYGDDVVDLEAGVPLPGPVVTEGRIQVRELPATRAAVTWHIGPYTKLSGAYRAIEAWIDEHGERVNGPPWEVYWTDPMSEEDSSKWRTEVGYPIA